METSCSNITVCNVRSGGFFRIALRPFPKGTNRFQLSGQIYSTAEYSANFFLWHPRFTRSKDCSLMLNSTEQNQRG